MTLSIYMWVSYLPAFDFLGKPQPDLQISTNLIAQKDLEVPTHSVKIGSWVNEEEPLVIEKAQRTLLLSIAFRAAAYISSQPSGNSC